MNINLRWSVLLACGGILGFTLQSCGVFNRDRRVLHAGIERREFGLPLVVYKSADGTEGKDMVLLLSGDGGWLSLVDSLAQTYASSGYNIVGLNSRSYFWQKKSPRRTADDLIRLMREYKNRWAAHRIILCGYSFGADVIPFIYNRLPGDLKGSVAVLQLLSPFADTNFTVELLTGFLRKGKYNVRSELQQVDIPVYLFYGKRERPRQLAGVRRRNLILKLLPGDHHYDGGYDIITAAAGSSKKGRRLPLPAAADSTAIAPR